MESLNPLDTVRIGIVGPSWWVNYWHLPAIENHPHAIITAVCGSSNRDSESVREKYGPDARLFTDYEKMFDSELIDGVIVCTPNDLHYPVTMAALKRGLHVTCEKPVAMTAEQAKEMKVTAQERHLLGMANFPYRDNPAAGRFRELVCSGYTGHAMHVTGAYHGAFGLGRPPGWRGLRERSGAGILGDLGSHLIDLVRYTTGQEFSSVAAHSMTALWGETLEHQPEIIRTSDPRSGVRNDDSCAFLAEFASGAHGLLHTSWVAWQGDYTQHQEVELYGTEGRLHFLATHAGTTLRGMRRGEKHWEVFTVDGTVLPDPSQEEDEDYFRPGRHTPSNTTYRWIEGIRTGKKTISPDFEDGWHSQQVIDAVIQASAERRWVDIP